MSELSLSGSCLCGGVRFDVSGTPGNFFHCHCGRCRKATGTGHASNIIVMSAELAFTEGEALVREYRVADAKYFGNTFCGTCGSRLPRFSPERGVAVIPAGSLDEDPGLSPDARIFTESAASWSCRSDDIPAHDRYPPRP